jgi:hypothetical protein
MDVRVYAADVRVCPPVGRAIGTEQLGCTCGGDSSKSMSDALVNAQAGLLTEIGP